MNTFDGKRILKMKKMKSKKIKMKMIRTALQNEQIFFIFFPLLVQENIISRKKKKNSKQDPMYRFDKLILLNMFVTFHSIGLQTLQMHEITSENSC